MVDLTKYVVGTVGKECDVQVKVIAWLNIGKLKCLVHAPEEVRFQGELDHVGQVDIDLKITGDNTCTIVYNDQPPQDEDYQMSPQEQSVTGDKIHILIPEQDGYIDIWMEKDKNTYIDAKVEGGHPIRIQHP